MGSLVSFILLFFNFKSDHIALWSNAIWNNVRLHAAASVVVCFNILLVLCPVLQQNNNDKRLITETWDLDHKLQRQRSDSKDGINIRTLPLSIRTVLVRYYRRSGQWEFNCDIAMCTTRALITCFEPSQWVWIFVYVCHVDWKGISPHWLSENNSFYFKRKPTCWAVN